MLWRNLGVAALCLCASAAVSADFQVYNPYPEELSGVFAMDAGGLDTARLVVEGGSAALPPSAVQPGAREAATPSWAPAQPEHDGQGDQDEINAAIGALPPAGGTVLLMEGTYDIRKVPDTLGGVTIARSCVTLAGQGTATKLIQAANQNANVIRIIGAGVGHVVIRDLYVDANRDENTLGVTDAPAHARFDFCGIKAYCVDPGQPVAAATHDITVRNCEVRNADSLGIMLIGPNMQVLDNTIGNARSDAVELLGGPGVVRGNYLDITGRVHVAIGSDMGNSILMTDNIVHVKKGGELDIGFRSWATTKRHNIAGNTLIVDAGGRCTLAMDVRGSEATVTGNNVFSAAQPTVLKVAAGNVVVTGNVLENAVILIDDATGGNKPIIVRDNILENSRIEHRTGKLVTTEPAQ